MARPKKRGYNAHAKRLRQAARKELPWLIQKQGGICHYCPAQLVIGVNTTIDHVVPISEGGGNRANIVAACSGCNSERNRQSHQLRRRRKVFKPIRGATGWDWNKYRRNYERH